MQTYQRGFLPYALAALAIGLVGGFSTVLGPAFVQDMGLAYSATTWTALAQAISTAACAPILGRVGDVIGRRTTLLAGLAVFTLGNVLSAMATSFGLMLLARFVVGLGTAAMAPVIVGYIVSEFPPERTAQGFSLYMLISSASVVAGPSLGGLMIARYGWRAMLWVCVAVCAAVLIACLFLRGEARTTRGSLHGFDAAGAAMVPLFFGLVLCLPAFGQNIGWRSGAFWAALAGAAGSLVGLILAERRAAQPILSGSFLRRRAFVLSVLALFLTQGLMQANMTNTIVFVNSTQPQNSAVSGYAISVMYLGMSLGALVLGPLADRHEPKHVLTLSFLVTAAGCALPLLFSAHTPVWLLMASLGLLGLGLGGNATIFMKVALAGLSPSQAGAGAGTYGLFRDMAAPFGVAVLVPLFTNRVAALTEAGTDTALAAVQSMRVLSSVELLCVAAGMVAVWGLPRIHQNNR